MNIRTFLPVVAIAITFAACNTGSDTAETSEAGEVANATENSVTYAIDPEASSLEWLGKELSGKTHNGTIAISEGKLSVEDGSIVAGSFIVDMTSIKDLDIEDPEDNAKLVGHLKDDAFFGVAEHPASTFEVTGIEAVAGEEGVTHHVTGNYTMKDITHEIKIPANVAISEDQITAQSTFSIDRSKWNVKFRSGSFFDDLGDKLIYDDIELTLNLVTKASMGESTASTQ